MELGARLAFVALVWAWALPAGAQSEAHDEEARALYQAGRVAFDDGRFEDALGYFERSHDLSGRPELLYNIGSAADRLRRNEYALESFEAYLEAVPDAHNRNSVEARMEVLRQAIAQDRAAPTPEQTAAAGLDQSDGGQATVPGVGDPETPPPSRRGLWIGLGVGAAALIGVAVILAIVLRDPDPDYRESDQGYLVFTLGSEP